MAQATVANTNRHTAWLWGIILPSILSRAAADAADKGHAEVPLFTCKARLQVTLKFDHKLAHNAFLVYMSIKGGQDDWAVFETDKAAPSHDRKNKVEYQTLVFYVGDDVF